MNSKCCGAQIEIHCEGIYTSTMCSACGKIRPELADNFCPVNEANQIQKQVQANAAPPSPAYTLDVFGVMPPLPKREPAKPSPEQRAIDLLDYSKSYLERLAELTAINEARKK